MDSSANRTSLEEDDTDLMFDTRGCCCFVSPWSRRRTSASASADWWGRIQAHDRSGVAWGLTSASMRLRDWSEIVAGPRWKTFIRRFNRNSKHLGGSARLGVRFQYDPLSYALNFDESPDADAGLRDFSSRFAAPPLFSVVSAVPADAAAGAAVLR